MKVLILILIIFISNIFCKREKLQIVNIDNPNFRPEETTDLVFGFSHMKHGASTPCYGLTGYYTDVFDQKWIGFCELTKKGFLQLFKLGKIYQQRYNKLLNISYPNINKVKSFASKANKTLMSSNALFYGMYINNNTPIEEQLTVPVRNFKNYVGKDLIPIFYYTESANCKGWKKIVENNIKNNDRQILPRFNKFYSVYKKVFDSIKNDDRMINSKSIIDQVNLFCSSYISNYYDDRYQNIDIFKELKFTKEQYYDLYYDCLDITLYRYLFVEYGGEARKVPMIVLRELINDMLYYMDEIIKNPQSNTKFVSFIGHDSTLAGFQIILEKGFNIPPRPMNFASNQIFLLYKDKDTQNEENIEKRYKVKYFYNDQLSMITQYDEFKSGLLNLMKTEYNLEYFCEGFMPYDYLVLGLCSAIIILFFSIISICFYHRNIIFNKKKYISLKEEPREKSVEIKN